MNSSIKGGIFMKCVTLILTTCLFCISQSAYPMEEYAYYEIDDVYDVSCYDNNNANDSYAQSDWNSYGDYPAYAANDSERRKRRSYGSERYMGRDKVFIFDPRLLTWYAYANGELVNT